MHRMISLTRLILFLIVFAFLTTTLYTAPTRGKDIRVIFIGYTHKYYYTYQVERDNPGSHYSFTDYVYLCKYFKEDAKIWEKILLRRVKHYAKNADPNCWVHEAVINEAFNVQKYLEENKVYYSHPSVELREYEVAFDEGGMYLTQNEKSSCYLLDMSRMKENYMEAPTFGWENWRPRDMKVVEYYHQYPDKRINPERDEAKDSEFLDGKFYFIVQYEDGNGYSVQFVVPLGPEIVSKARKNLRKQEKAK